MNTATETKRYKPYPEYKDSGVEWLGDVPEHWEVDRLRWTVLGCKNGIWGNEPDGVDDLVCVRVADFDRTKFRVMIDEPTVRAVTLSERRGRLLQQGNLLLEKSGGGELQPVGAVMLFEHDTDAVCSNFVARMPVSDGFDSVFMTYLHAHLYARRVNTRSIKQTTGIQNLDSMAYLDERVVCPPSTEQQAIADFLDRRTGQIDDLIAKKERVIELLRQKRTAIISHTVTKGLNPDVKMKDSGIDWLEHNYKFVAGDRFVPWLKSCTISNKFKPLKYLCDVNANVLPENTPPNTDIIYIDISSVNSDGKVINQEELDFDSAPSRARRILSDGDVFLSTVRTYLRAISYVEKAEHNLICSTGFAVISPGSEIYPKFLFYWVRSSLFVDEVVARSVGVSYPAINALEVGNLPFPMIDINEQQAIADFLNRETSRIDALIAKITEVIEKLKEYRTALISVAVTGKIDVRKEIA